MLSGFRVNKVSSLGLMSTDPVLAADLISLLQGCLYLGIAAVTKDPMLRRLIGVVWCRGCVTFSTHHGKDGEGMRCHRNPKELNS